MCALYQDGTTRYNELKRKLKGITNTMLASSLRELERDGLVSRELYDERPIRVEYTLQPAAGALLPILGQLAQWGALLTQQEG
jgi:DNA-binding HxlR family transcriptional regulator